MAAKKISINLESGDSVSGLLLMPASPKVLLVLAHGAGAGMGHPFMENLCTAFRDKSIATLRFQFLYMEKGSKRPDTAHVAHQAWKAALAKAVSLKAKNDLHLIAGGKSFGGRMLSQLMALENLKEVEAIVFFGFPLHPAGKPGISRAEHLKEVKKPMLFLQGTRDTLAQEDLIVPVVKSLKKASLVKLQGADHSFKMLKSVGMQETEMMERLATETYNWLLIKGLTS